MIRTYLYKGEPIIQENEVVLDNNEIFILSNNTLFNVNKKYEYLNIAEHNKDLIYKLVDLGILKNSKSCRDYNVGSSDYSKHIIQPWSIWKDYNLNPWDADIVKRVLRTKKESGKSEIESRIMDYEKIIHICKERIRQLKCDRNE